MQPEVIVGGIAGAWTPEPGAAEAAVGRMLRALTHRGPHIAHAEPHGTGPAPVWLGCVAQKFDEESTPDWPPARGLPPLVIDGGVHNVPTLADRLLAAGVSLGRPTRWGIVAAALGQWGDGVIAGLRGHFALAWYDDATRSLLLARDPLGVKPLFVATTAAGGVVFASAVRALVASGLVADDYDPAGVAIYLAHGHLHAPHTLHRGVRGLPAGHWQRIDVSGAGTPRPATRYWRLPDPGPDPGSEAAVDRLCAALDDAVSVAARDVPALSAHLPGDLESAVIAKLACRWCPDVRTSFVEIESEGHEERARIATAIAAQLDVRHFQMIVDEEWSGTIWKEWLQAADVPCVAGYEAYVTAQAIKGTGAAVALFSGGGAELFRGLPVAGPVAWLVAAQRRVAGLPRWLRRSAVRRIVAATSPPYRELVASALVAPTPLADAALLAERVFFDAELARLGLAHDAVGVDPRYLPAGWSDGLAAGGSAADELLRMQCLLWLPERTAPVCDASGMANSIELRLPYLDRQFIETLLAIPGVVAAPKPSRSGQTLQRIGKALLPFNLLQRREPSPAFPLTHWMTGPLREYCASCIDTAATCPVLDGAAVQACWSGFLEAPRFERIRPVIALVSLGACMQESGRLRRRAGGA